MTFSYTQIAQYLRCPRSYRYRYLDGWREKDNRASLLFGRALRRLSRPSSRRGQLEPLLFKEWGAYREAQLEYSQGDDWERMFRQGVQLLERLAQDNRIRIRQPNATCRSSWSGRSRAATTSWPTSMRLGPGRQAPFARMEDHHGTLSGRARRTVGA